MKFKKIEATKELKSDFKPFILSKIFKIFKIYINSFLISHKIKYNIISIMKALIFFSRLYKKMN